MAATTQTVTVTEEQLAQAFMEWDRRYREEPARFMSEGERLLKETPKDYGEACAPYLVHILDEMGIKKSDGITIQLQVDVKQVHREIRRAALIVYQSEGWRRFLKRDWWRLVLCLPAPAGE